MNIELKIRGPCSMPWMLRVRMLQEISVGDGCHMYAVSSLVPSQGRKYAVMWTRICGQTDSRVWTASRVRTLARRGRVMGGKMLTIFELVQKMDTNLERTLLLLLFALIPSSHGAQIPSPDQPKEIPVATNGQLFPWDRMRLPKTISPLHYDLSLHPNLTTLDFTGVVRIDLDVHEDTSVVVLHAKKMHISSALLLAPAGTRVLQVLEYPRFHQLALMSDVVLTKGRKYEVQLEFAANLSDSYHGFYKSSYRTSTGEVRVMASTQFEATFARGAFPCFDEPAFKANFTIRIIREPRHIAISNMPKKWYSGDELDVRAIMDTWTLQEGFPLVTVEVKGREVRLSQERFLRTDNPSLTEGFLWQIPLTYMTSASRSVHRFLLKTKSDVLYLPEEVDWVKFNVNMSGYYMVHYGGGGWNSIISLLHHNHTALSGNDRASLIHNVFQLVSVEKVRLDTALELSLYLSRETEIMAVWQGFGELVPLYKLMEKRDMPELENQMKSFIVDLFRGLIDQQEWNDSGSVSQRVLRSYLLLFACVRNYSPCVTKATRLFNQWRDSDGTMSLPVDITMAVFMVGARTREGWDFLYEKYRTSLQMSVKRRLKWAMAVTTMTDKLQWMMEQSLNGEVMKTQDLPDVIVSVARNPHGFKLAWDFLRTHWHTLIQKFDLGSSTISHLVAGVTNQYSTREMLHEIRSFFDSLTEEAGSQMRCIQQSYETIEDNIRWMDRNLPLLQAWLNKHGSRNHHQEL
ncbi:endoplasmic reticulum aminopeptidase 1-like [Oryzias latipes]|uniref:endoplasmic reticulum aminopeptidase 1-like n=1 Tax=Oryzias latipes TaxID=8090 RepID=UPI000CE1B37C|nr:endoplasmic reticulum aminopeptidase 1-like [Oryzias latipes]